MGGQNITFTPIKLNLNKERINIGGFTFDSNGNITILEDGIYEINYSVAYKNVSTILNFVNVVSELRLNGISIKDSDIFTTHAVDPTSSQSGSRSIIIKLNADDMINIWSRLKSGSGSIFSLTSGSGITIKKLD